jgi:predicted  nucleic acid-binding Zn-ribbon protein
MKHVVDLLLKLQTLQSGKLTKTVEKEISGLKETIPAPILAHYDRLTSRGKQGVAIVRNSVCSVCHMGATVGSISSLINGDDLQICGSCGRYLYLPPEEKARILHPPPDPKPVRRKPKKTREPE